MKKIIIKRCDAHDSPREWENMTKMICFHGNYRLGDKFDEYKPSMFNGWEELEEQLHKDYNIAAILPLYLYDHFGITISTSSLNDRWDSGQVGFIFVTKETMLDERGGKILTKKLKEQAIEICEADVKIYDQYLCGEVYGYEIIEEVEMVSMTKQDWEVGNCDNVEHFTEDIEIDSCGGFYGDDWFENGMSDYIPKELHELLKTTEITYN